MSGALYLALHEAGGTSVVATLGHNAVHAFVRLFNDAIERIQQGEFCQLETRQ